MRYFDTREKGEKSLSKRTRSYINQFRKYVKKYGKMWRTLLQIVSFKLILELSVVCVIFLLVFK